MGAAYLSYNEPSKAIAAVQRGLKKGGLKSRDDAGAPPSPFGGVRNDVLAVVVGLIAYVALVFAFHPAVIGVPVIGV